MQQREMVTMEDQEMKANRFVKNRVGKVSKRGFDIFVALAGLTLLWPVFAVVAIYLKRSSPGPVFYRGPRVGRDGKPFSILKFRTMQDCPECENGSKVTAEDDPRITPGGRWLRASKLNEIPQLWNVLIGEMSLVGPRPEDPEVVATWPEEVRLEILSIRPGISSPASIYFRDEERLLRTETVMEKYLSSIVPTKIRLDQIYVRDHNLIGDLDVIFMTAIALIPSLRERSIPENVLLWGPLARFFSRHVNWFLVDVPIAFVAVGFSGVLWRVAGPFDLGLGLDVLLALGIGFLFGLSNAILGMNRISWSQARPMDASGLVVSNAIITLLFILADRFLFPDWSFPLGMWLMISILALAGFVIARYRFRLVTGLATRWLQWRGAATRMGERVLIVGAGEMAQFTTQLLHQNGYEKAFNIIGLVDDDVKKLGSNISGCKVLGSTQDLGKLIEKWQIGAILFSIGNLPQKQQEKLLADCTFSGVRLVLVPDILNVLAACLIPLQSPPDQVLVSPEWDGKIPAQMVISWMMELETLALSDHLSMLSRLQQIRDALAADLTQDQHA